MTRFNNNRFTPGNKGNLRLFINKAFIKQYYRAFNTNQLFENINNSDDITEGTLCGCIPQQANPIKQGWNDPSQSENIRIAKAITGTLGGKITYGNLEIRSRIPSLSDLTENLNPGTMSPYRGN